MMRALVIATALAALHGPAAAQDPATSLADRSLIIQGEAPAACVVGLASATGDNVEVSPSDAGITVNLLPGSFVDSQSFPTGGKIEIVVPILCNSSHTLVVTSQRQGLRTNAEPGSNNDFLNVAPFVLAVDWAGHVGQFDTASEQSVTLNVPDAASGEVTLLLGFTPLPRRLIAGVYNDELIVEVSAAY